MTGVAGLTGVDGTDGNDGNCLEAWMSASGFPFSRE